MRKLTRKTGDTLVSEEEAEVIDVMTQILAASRVQRVRCSFLLKLLSVSLSRFSSLPTVSEVVSTSRASLVAELDASRWRPALRRIPFCRLAASGAGRG